MIGWSRLGGCWALLATALAVQSPDARAADAGSTLVVVSAEGNPSEGDAVVHRIGGELQADGMTVAVDRVLSGEPVTALLTIARETEVALVVGVLVAPDGLAVEVVLADPHTERVVRRHLEAEVGDRESARAVLARRTVDLVRASLLDFAVEDQSVPGAAKAAKAVKAEGTKPVAGRAPSVDRSVAADGVRWTAATGAAILACFRGLGPQVVPVLRTGVAPRAPLQLRATVAWFGTQPTVSTVAGSAAVRQGVSLAEVVVVPWRHGWLRPVASVGAGLYYVGVEGHGTAPYVGIDTSSVAFAWDGGLGGIVRLSPQIDLALESFVVFTVPGLAVRFLDQDVARIGRPSLLSTLALSVTL